MHMKTTLAATVPMRLAKIKKKKKNYNTQLSEGVGIQPFPLTIFWERKGTVWMSNELKCVYVLSWADFLLISTE